MSKYVKTEAGYKPLTDNDDFNMLPRHYSPGIAISSAFQIAAADFGSLTAVRYSTTLPQAIQSVILNDMRVGDSILLRMGISISPSTTYGSASVVLVKSSDSTNACTIASGVLVYRDRYCIVDVYAESSFSIRLRLTVLGQPSS